MLRTTRCDYNETAPANDDVGTGVNEGPTLLLDGE